MNFRNEWKGLILITGVFLIFYYLPFDSEHLQRSLGEALLLTQWYAREHVLLCLIPAFFIAGAIGTFVRHESVMKYLGDRANRIVAYGVASVSGSVLAVCSCTILPLFAGIYRMGAGLGPATAFLYAGPAINVLAIILTARILGLELGIARAVGAVVFSIVIGLLMQLIFRSEEESKIQAQEAESEEDVPRPLWQTASYFAAMIAILVFATWSEPDRQVSFWYNVYSFKWVATGLCSTLLGVMLVLWFRLRWWLVTGVGVITAGVGFSPAGPVAAYAVAVVGLSVITATSKGEGEDWFSQTWGFAKQILPLLFFGVLMAGLLLGRPDQEGLIPSEWISQSVGGNSLGANLFASVIGAFMYFATLTEVPILQGLLGSGMGKGPALALLLAGPALSLPNMLVIRSVMGTKKTVVFVVLVITMATISGMIFGTLL
ncbi:MAG: permease [candidate division Zixibacteria bacterium]|nr:permease [candidate division Zixibacteria bacterium]